MMLLLFSFLLIFESVVVAQKGPTNWTATPFNAPSFPLAVKTPYVNAWDPQGNVPEPVSNSWPRIGSTFFTPLGWFTAITVDGVPYQLMGQFHTGMNIANQTAVLVTPTRTSIIFETGPVTVNATYLSPVTPNDLVQQSLPFSYYYLSFTSNATHAIKVYSDITGEWMSGDNSLQSNWSATDDGSVVYLQTQLTTPSPFQELNDRPMDGVAYHAMLHRSGISWQIEDATPLRSAFGNGSVLNNTVDPTFHPVGVPFFDTLSFALDLGTIQNTSEPVVWAVGVVRDPVIKFSNSNGQLEERRAYYWSTYSNIHDAILGVLSDFVNALNIAVALDNQILHDGSQVSTNYYDLLALTTRQAMGAIDITVGQDSSGNLNSSDIMAFMRGAGGIGSGGVNCVDVIYAASPIYLYLNSSLLGYLLRPLLEYQESSLYPNPYAAIDIGTNYSMAIGNNEEHVEGIERSIESGNMLIMTYVHAQRTGDTSLLSQHYNLLRGWADYLVNNSLTPESQHPSLSDGISAINQTNLALKGIIGIGAMAKVSLAMDQSNDAIHYQTVASNYIQQWRTLAFSSDQSHIMTQYGQDSSFSLIYNLYAHKLLQLNLLNESDFATQTAFYKSRLDPTQFGLPLDSSSPTMTRSDWMMFTAAIATDNTVRDGLITQLHEYASPNKQNQPFEIVYNPVTADQITGSSSPAQGAMFALLANNVPIKLNPSGGSTGFSDGNEHSKNIGAIAGLVVVGVVSVAAIVGALFFFLRRRQLSIDYRSAERKGRAQAVRRVRPSSCSSEAILEPFGPMTQLPSTENQRNLSSQTARFTSSVSILQSSGTSTAYTPSSLGSPMVSDVSFSAFPSMSGAVLEKQRLMMLGIEDAVTAKSVPGASVPLREATPLAEGDNLAHSPVVSTRNTDPDLRLEVEDLRREIERMRQDREAVQEAPPMYDSVLEEEGLRH